MNKNLLMSGFISVSFHALLLFIPLYSIFVKNIDIDLIKAPASMEISFLRPLPPVEVKPRKIERLPEAKPKEKEPERAEPVRREAESIINSKPMIGAITEQVSSLMINRPPAYPALARLKGWEGKVVLTANIGRDGRVRRVSVLSSSGFYVLDRAAVKAIYTWQFRNVAEPTVIKIPIKFVLTSPH